MRRKIPEKLTRYNFSKELSHTWAGVRLLFCSFIEQKYLNNTIFYEKNW